MNPDDLFVDEAGDIMCHLGYYADEIFIGNREQAKELIAKLQALVVELGTEVKVL
ncbi:hypothetical protein KNT87_gp166 [Erwinia phage Cronus]|uniref:Uncharacterized protein n=1 Tax=Erwinia phage Cronus TaxID=2163633 RepID=A0A2S1GM38_9CAUD|nr:hypothetical protein KNT87_gp166 [Erwinia phage Cronus]AWD90403.1 hypothetical protein [Erwinia phage Cronus]